MWIDRTRYRRVCLTDSVRRARFGLYRRCWFGPEFPFGDFFWFFVFTAGSFCALVAIKR